jgi:hypothetical protein
MSAHTGPVESVITQFNGSLRVKERRHSKSQSAFNYDHTSSNLAATTMLKELKSLIETAPPAEKEVRLRLILAPFSLAINNRL